MNNAISSVKKLTGKKTFPNVAKKVVSPLLSLLFWGGIWWLLSLRVGNSFLLPKPLDVIKCLGTLVLTAPFWKITAASLLRVLIGIIIATLCGIMLAVVTTRIKTADALMSPLLGTIKATPIASFIILALVWISRNFLPIFTTFLIVLPIVWSNVSAGLRSVDRGLLEVAGIYRFSRAKKIRVIYIPSVMPYFSAAFRTSLGMAWKAGIAAEVLSAPKLAIGTELYLSKTYLETTALFAWTLVVIVLSLIIEKIFVYVLLRFGRRYGAR